MKDNEIKDIRSLLLKCLQPTILGLSLIVFILLLRTNLPGSYERRAYSLLIGTLVIIDAVAFYATMKQNYRLSSLLTVSLSLIGSWGAIIIDSRYGLTEYFPLIYVTVNVLLASVLLPLLITVAIATIQMVVLVFLVFQHPALLAYNWQSFLSYVLIGSSLCIVANYISSYQLKLFKESSIRDHLTGLLNRRYFDVTLEDKIHRSHSKQYTYGVMLLDIDNFKTYNDRYSHAVGDIILQRVGSFLQDKLEMQSVVCRHGGDEFSIIIPNTNQMQLYNKAEKLRFEVKGVPISDICPNGEKLSISIGLSIFPENGRTVEDVMDYADKNLMAAKESGKDRVMAR